MEVFNPWGYHPAIGVAPWKSHRFPSQGDMFPPQAVGQPDVKETHIQCQRQIHKLSLSLYQSGAFRGGFPQPKL